MATPNKKVKEEKSSSSYDFHLRKPTKMQINAKSIPCKEMAQGMLRRHGYEAAKRIIDPLTVKAFKDKDGNPVAPNPHSTYWLNVLQALTRAAKGA